MYKLIIEDDEGKTTVVPLIRDEITIGRKEGNTIRLTERNVSRRHARLCRQNGSLFIEDAQSYNGVRVNGSRLTGRAAVREGDRIQIGDYLLAVQLDRAAAVEPITEVQTTVADANEPTRTEQVPAQALSPEGPRPKDPPEPRGATPAASVAPTAPRAAHATPLGGEYRPGHGPSNGAATPVGPTAVVAVASPATAPMAAPPSAASPIRSPEPHSPTAGALAAAVAPRLEEPAKSPADAVAPARLVVLSSNFAGKEYPLAHKPSYSIGRTEDNDVVIQHRSISRHHAKINVEQSHYSIVDQHSSNGIRVNGQEYGQVELRKGDLIDLGHIRLRFVEPGEDFVFGRDADVQDVVVRRRSGVVRLAGMVVAFLVGCVCIALFTGLLPRKASTLVADATGLGVSATNPGGAGGELQAEQRYLAQASQAVKDERWDDALLSSSQALAKNPSSAAAEEIRKKAASEKANALLFEQFKAAEAAGQFADVVTRFNAIASDSIYKSRAQPAYTKLRGEYIEANLELASDARQKGSCDEVKRIVDLVLSVDENNPRAAGLVAQCTRPVDRGPAGPTGGPATGRGASSSPIATRTPAAASSPTGSNLGPTATAPATNGVAIQEPRTQRPEPEPTVAPQPSNAGGSNDGSPSGRPPKRATAAAGTGGAASAPTGGSDAQLAQLLADAETAWVRQQYNTAIDYAERALKIDPNSPRAIQLIGAVSCTLNDAQRAAWAHRRLDQGRRRLLRLVCDRAGVDLP
jgi:pSer/pThr/pTyr-binding forkhead associated (FHA) protein